MDKYNDLLEQALGYYFSNDEFIKYFGRIPLSRKTTFEFCLNHLNKKEDSIILELGTSRSYVDGRFPGCNSDNPKYWEPNCPEKWDWSAGHFTRVFSELTNKNTKLYTVDIDNRHINRCKIMTEDFKDKISYFVMSSEDCLNRCLERTIDLLYLDTGDMTPIEDTAQLHLLEAKIIVEKNILKDDGLILIDDVRSCVPKKVGEISDYGKAKYSIPYFLDNGYKIVMDEYQVILQRK